jgi:hypothetical protein
LTPAQSFEFERCRRDAHYLLFDSGYLRTKDEHDQISPVKAFPDEPYLRVYLDWLLVSGRVLRPVDAKWAIRFTDDTAFLGHIHSTGVLFIEKSRQVMVSWLTAAYLLWRFRALSHQLILVQSKAEEDAAALVYNKDPTFARISFLETTLPQWLQMLEFPKDGAYCHLYNRQNGSEIEGIAEGAHKIRSRTPSVFFSDEAAFQPEFGKAYTAAIPAVHGGGQLVCVSSAEPGEFANLVEAAA